LAGLPSAAVERLLAEVVDVCSHRLDAWVTAHASRRLDALRARRPDGVRVGGYGVLYDLRPAPVLTLADQGAQLQAALTAANQDADAAAAARAPIADQQAAALSQDASASNAVASLNTQIDDLTAERDNLVEIVQEEEGEPGNTGAIQAALRRIHD